MMMSWRSRIASQLQKGWQIDFKLIMLKLVTNYRHRPQNASNRRQKHRVNVQTKCHLTEVSEKRRLKLCHSGSRQRKASHRLDSNLLNSKCAGAVVATEDVISDKSGTTEFAFAAMFNAEEWR